MSHCNGRSLFGSTWPEFYIEISGEDKSRYYAPENYVSGIKYFAFMPQNCHQYKKGNYIPNKRPEDPYKKADYAVVFLDWLVVLFRHCPSPKKSQNSIN